MDKLSLSSSFLKFLFASPRSVSADALTAVVKLKADTLMSGADLHGKGDEVEIHDIEALPPELLRKGRFDEIFFVDLPSASVRERIFEIHLKKRKRDPQKFDCRRLAQASEGFSGAEIEQAVLSALHEAFGQKGDVDTDLILAAVEQSVPLSVTMAEKIDALRRWAQNRCVPAD